MSSLARLAHGAVRRRRALETSYSATVFVRHLSTQYEYVAPGGVETLSILRSAVSSREIYLVGTAHVSEKSAREVRELVRLARPQAVMVELCAERLRSIRDKIEEERRRSGESSGSRGSGKSDLVMQIVKDFVGALSGSADVRDGLLGAAMKAFYGFFKLSGLDPGAEFKEAVKEADALGAEVIAGDRDVRETLRRVRESVTFADVMTMMSGRVKPGGPSPPEGMEGGFDNIEHVVENLKTRRHIRQMRDFMHFQMPRLASVFVDERDEMMTNELLKCRHERVVAVVGMAHMDGIERRWNAAQKRLSLGKGS